MPADRPALSRERVVDEAVALADEQGLPALSMRALAGRLTVEAMSLYHHVPGGKDALLDAMVDAVFAEMHLPTTDGDWRAQLRLRSVSGRAALRRHRWAVGLMDSSRTPGPATIAHHDAVIGCMLAGGFSLSASGTAFALVDAHLYGFLLQENALPFETVDELAAIGTEILVPEVRAAFPHFTRFAETHAMRPGYSFGYEFEPSLDLVLDAVERLLDPGRPPAQPHVAPPVVAPPPVEVVVPVLGVDGCPGGWVGALLVPGAPRPRVVVAPTIAELVETVRSEVEIAVVGIDIPIGLPDSTIRRADVLARRELRGGASSVFTTLTRAAYLEATRAEADTVNRALSGQGVGAQAFALRAKILEVDAWRRSRPTVEVVEVHPEVSFRAMTGGTALPSKKTEEGQRARLEALGAAGIAQPSVLKGSGYAADDVLDACAVAWTAARRVAGLSRSLPEEPEVFGDGIEAAIHV
ncbi:DUF429 domain-containing protein [Oryzobacter telluris]|uniref:DUF429 domain-containing protein n=1 Tax=Oryzobacter telluris TaxID=3149179 RepID=UPI00370DB7DD